MSIEAVKVCSNKTNRYVTGINSKLKKNDVDFQPKLLSQSSPGMLGGLQVQAQVGTASSLAPQGSPDPHFGHPVLIRSIVADHM